MRELWSRLTQRQRDYVTFFGKGGAVDIPTDPETLAWAVISGGRRGSFGPLFGDDQEEIEAQLAGLGLVRIDGDNAWPTAAFEALDAWRRG